MDWVAELEQEKQKEKKIKEEIETFIAQNSHMFKSLGIEIRGEYTDETNFIVITFPKANDSSETITMRMQITDILQIHGLVFFPLNDQVVNLTSLDSRIAHVTREKLSWYGWLTYLKGLGFQEVTKAMQRT